MRNILEATNVVIYSSHLHCPLTLRKGILLLLCILVEMQGMQVMASVFSISKGLQVVETFPQTYYITVHNLWSKNEVAVLYGVVWYRNVRK